MDTKKLKQKVLDLAIRGKLVPQDPNDEPASKLLERIYAEKQKLIAEGKIKKEKRSSFIFKGEDNSYYEKVVENGKETIRDITDEIPFDIPETWAWTRLSSISEEISAGGDKPITFSKEKTTENVIPIYSNGLEKEGLYGYTNVPRIDRTAITLSARGTIGYPFVREGNFVPIIRLVAIVPIRGLFNLSFLYYILFTRRLTSDGSSIPQLTVPSVRPYILPVPPLNEQRRIVSTIEGLANHIADINEEYDTLSAKIAKTKSKLLDLAIRGKLLPQNPNDDPASALLERIREEQESIQTKRKNAGSYIFKGEDNLYYRKTKDGIELIDDELPFKLPENWQWAQISDVCVLYTGNSIPKEVKAKKYANVSLGYNYIGTKDVGYNSQINYENGVKIPFDEPKFKVAPTNSILLCIEGGNAGRKIAITKENVCFGNKLCCFIAKGINYCFLYNYLKSSIFKELFYGSLMGLIGGVGTSSLEKIYIPIPPLQEQERISEFLTSAFDQLDSLAQH